MPSAKPSMKTSLSLLLSKIEVERGVDSLPTAALDAFLVGDLDLQLDPTLLERNIFSVSLSNIPSSVGRKVVNVNFNAELKGSGDAAGTRPKIGSLLRACGMHELLVTAGAATQIEDAITFGTVAGPAVTWAKSVAPTATFGSYRVKVVTGGASATAALQVSRWESGVPDTTVLPNTRHIARNNDSAATLLTLDSTDLTSLEFTVGGVFQAGDDLYATIGGCTFAYTTLTGDATTDGVATALAAIINADSRLSASATLSVITVTFLSGALPSVVTSGITAVALGNSAAEIIPTWTGNLVAGQEWIVSLYEEGYMYRPLSNQVLVESTTLYVYKDGALHKVTACQGNVTFTGESGQLAQAAFEFQGNYLGPVEEPTPLDAITEQTIPPQVEFAQMSIAGDGDFCAQSFTYVLGNTINLKECMNAGDGFDGAQITERDTTATLNPDATFEAYTGMWANFSNAAQFPLHTRVGTISGNMVRFYAPRANFTGLTYGDRNNSVTLEAAFSLNGLSAAGDDELRIAFP